MSDGNLPNKAPDVHPAPKEEDMTLARYGGEKPAAPDWFNWAIAQEASEASVEVDGTRIAYRSWGDPSKPGLLLAHGNGAHARLPADDMLYRSEVFAGQSTMGHDHDPDHAKPVSDTAPVPPKPLPLGADFP